ncbi:hypothetical protein Slin14017_G055180 [Septoria linicola]|nr:hypothetical protein Slin14017_G055180 [Septoria linicola]
MRNEAAPANNVMMGDGGDSTIQRIRSFAAKQLREEFPYMKTATLETMLDDATKLFSNAVLDQQTELEVTKSRINFFCLSAELRNQIYELVLVENRSIDIDPSKLWWETSTRRSPPGVLCTNRQVRKEALPIYYGSNTFCCILDGPMRQFIEARKWFRKLGQEKASLLTKVDMVFMNRGPSLSSMFHSYHASRMRSEDKALEDIVQDGLSLHERFAKILECAEAGITVSSMHIVWAYDQQSYHHKKAGDFPPLPSVRREEGVDKIDMNKKLTRAEMLDWLKVHR